jgi:hypothetical protein
MQDVIAGNAALAMRDRSCPTTMPQPRRIGPAAEE